MLGQGNRIWKFHRYGEPFWGTHIEEAKRPFPFRFCSVPDLIPPLESNDPTRIQSKPHVGLKNSQMRLPCAWTMTVDEIVAAYIRDCRAGARAEMREFQRLASLTDAIRHAARCHWLCCSNPPEFKKHPHQYRMPRALLDAAEHRLQNASDTLSAAADFEALHDIADKTIGKKQGLGELAVYDIAHRIGAFLGKEPTLVYLHTGTREGARELGFTGKTLNPALLPAPFSRLTPAEIEDCLCIYKDELSTGQLRARVSQPISRCIASETQHVRKC